MVNVTEMRFQNAGEAWKNWENYAGTKLWTLPPGDETKTVNAEFKGAGGTVSRSDSIILDMTAPTVSSFMIDSGNPTYSRDTYVELYLNVSGATQMRFANSGSAWSAWQSYSNTKAWTLVPGDGLKRVYAEFQDQAENVRQVYDEIVLDSTPPTASIAINGGNTYVWRTGVVLSLSANDATSGINSTVYLRNSSSSTFTPVAFGSPKNWTIEAGDGTKTVYFRVFDKAGNYGDVYDSIALDTTPVNSFLINAGASSTNTANVTLNCSVNGATQMRFRNYPSAIWSSWESFATSKSWSLASLGGVTNENSNESVYTEFSDGYGTFTVFDAIYFDAIRRLKITAEYLYITYDSDDSLMGSGEIYWSFYGKYSGGGTFGIYNRSRSVS